MPSYLITGASRGLGYETTKQLLAASPDHVIFAAARNPDSASQLQQLAKANEGRVHLIALDTTSQESVASAVKQVEKLLGNKGLDVILNNAGVFAGTMAPFSHSEKDTLDANLLTNVYGVIYTTQGFLPLLKKGDKKQIFVTSSVMGSKGDDLGKTPYAINYSVSKAAINMWTLKVANELGPEGFTVIPFHPGYVKTDMNGDAAEITPEDSVEKTLKNIILKVTPKDNGRFLSYTGTELKW